MFGERRLGALSLIRNEGLDEGLARGRSTTLLRLLKRRGFVVDGALETRIARSMNVAQLDRWLDRALDARSIDDVFA